MVRFSATALLTLLCFTLLTCSEGDPCDRLYYPEDFASCPALCNSGEPTAVACYLDKVSIHTGLFKGAHALLLEKSGEGEAAIKAYWLMGLTGEDMVEILDLPFKGVPSTCPPAWLRSSDREPERYDSKMSLYFRYFTGEKKCVIEMASVMTWTLQHPDTHTWAIDFQRSFMLKAIHGECSDSVLNEFVPTNAWKTTGDIFRPEGYSTQEPDCSEDDWCNPECLVDFDCECHYDGDCNPYACRGDKDCSCEQDFICNESCHNDPDCACIENGRCNRNCGALDPDCDCDRDEACNRDCIRDDPDCNCDADGACNPICGWTDEDCRCLEDEECNRECQDRDPDC